MIVEKNIDYLQFNCEKLPMSLRGYDMQDSFLSHYKKMYRFDDGTTAHFGNAITEKYHVVMPADVCRNLQHEFGVKGMCEYVAGAGEVSVTRIDLAITQFIDNDGLVTPSDVQAWYAADMIACKHVKHGSMYVFADRPFNDEKIAKGETFYIGDWARRGKHGIFRAYDKGLDFDLGRYLITRLEIEDKRRHANVTFKRLLAGNEIGSVFKTRFDVADDYFQALVDAPSIDISRGKQIETDAEEERLSRWNWLMRQVAPALGKQIADDTLLGYGHENWIEFMSEVKKHHDAHIHDNVD